MPALTPLLAYAVVALAVLLAFAGIVAVNLLVLPRTTRLKAPAVAPRVAVLVPARNEEANIEACLRSLLRQRYPGLQVWLYDDCSTDGTLEAARSVAADAQGGGATLRIVEGRDAPPPGWLGKAHALHRLYEELVKQGSAPDYLLFTDADVRFEPEAIGRAVALAEARSAGLLSIFPRQELGSFAERLAVPVVLHWTVYNFLPLPVAFGRVGGPAFAAANGQFILFTRDAYQACGGHEAVKGEILEDVALARATKRAGYTSLLADGGASVRTRMYRGLAEVWRGYSKNAFAFFGYKPHFLALGIIVLLALYVLPAVLAVAAFIAGEQVLGWLFVAQYLAAVATRLALSWRFAFPPADSFLHPLAVLFMIAIQVNSMVWALTGRGAWKGRGVAK